METPVVYFYAPREWRVEVHVGFPRGVISQWYPGATAANLWSGRRSASGASGDPGGFDLDAALASPRENGFLRWGRAGELRVLGPEERADLPEVPAGDPWLFSRAVAANDLAVTNYSYAWDEQFAPVEGAAPREEHERFLFYRGLADFELPLACEVAREEIRGDRCEVALALSNRAPAEPIARAFLIFVEDDRAAGRRSGFVALPDLAQGTLRTSVAIPLAPLAQSADELERTVAARLEETGLFADEALAMARTWRHSWFEEEGLRVLYVLPPALIERELPLEVRPHQGFEWKDGEARPLPPDPAPDEVLRTFVGRLDLLSPERERRLADTLAACLGPDPGARRRAADEVRSWGRYAEPFLRRAALLGVAPPALATARALVEG